MVNDRDILLKDIMNDFSELNNVITETKRMINITLNVKIIQGNIDKRFNDITSFNKTDWMFLAFAIALQISRQYLLTDFKERLNDKDAANNTWGHTKEHSNRFHRWYHPSIEDIKNNPVPFDTNYGSPNFSLGLHGTQHRYKTLGHDPLLGWYWGTMNILTSTLTTWDLQSFHIKTGYIQTGAARDKILNRASNEKILEYSVNRSLNEGKEGKLALATAFLKEFVHLRTDIKSTQSLPLPFISRLSPNLAKELSTYGFDIQNLETVGKQATLSILLNWVIASIHKLCQPQDVKSDLYEVKTRKILLYSNSIATSSNILFSVLTENCNKLDIGGSLVTIYRIINDVDFIERIKREFISDEFQIIIDSNKNQYGF